MRVRVPPPALKTKGFLADQAGLRDQLGRLNPAQRGVAKEKARQNLSARFAGACPGIWRSQAQEGGENRVPAEVSPQDSL